MFSDHYRTYRKRFLYFTCVVVGEWLLVVHTLAVSENSAEVGQVVVVCVVGGGGVEDSSEGGTACFSEAGRWAG